MRHVTIVLTILASASCDRQEEPKFGKTPDGYRVTYTLDGHYPPAEILSEYDSAVVRAGDHLARYGLPFSTVQAMAWSTDHYVMPGYKFRVPGSPTGWASGLLSGSRIVVAWDTKGSLDGTPHAPVLGHELGHIYYGPAFEHTWTPPVVAFRTRDGSPLPPMWVGECSYGEVLDGLAR